MLSAFLWLASLTSNLNAAPTFAERAQVKRSVAELQESYDYVVIGGGTSGLVVANRLSEDPASTLKQIISSPAPTDNHAETVLVVELGYIADESCIYQPRTIGDRSACAKHRFNISGIPQPEINNQVWAFPLGAVVGGSSAVNGMYHCASVSSYVKKRHYLNTLTITRCKSRAWSFAYADQYFLQAWYLTVAQRQIMMLGKSWEILDGDGTDCFHTLRRAQHLMLPLNRKRKSSDGRGMRLRMAMGRYTPPFPHSSGMSKVSAVT
jgi:hypothetical protein